MSKPPGRTRMLHDANGARATTCRKSGCSVLAAKRYDDPAHAWNDFCNEHADEAEAALARRTVLKK